MTKQLDADQATVSSIGTRSAECDAINQALWKGSKLADLVCADPVFTFTDVSGFTPAIGAPESKKPAWWAFWR